MLRNILCKKVYGLHKVFMEYNPGKEVKPTHGAALTSSIGTLLFPNTVFIFVDKNKIVEET